MKTVELVIEEGLIAAVKIPNDTRVVVRDYSVDGLDLDAEDIKQDKKGDYYIESVFLPEDVYP